MKKQSKSVSLKKQLVSAVSMMLAAAVALGSSTYAWFVNKSRAEVKDVLFQASAGKNMEISGGVVEDSTHTNGTTKFSGLTVGQQVPQGKANLLTYWSSVTPKTVGEYSFTYPAYSSSGSTYMMTPLSIDGADLKLTPQSTTFFINNAWDSTATSNGNASGAYYTYDKVKNNNHDDPKYICAQLYFKSSADLDVYLNEAEWQSYTGSNDASDEIPFITYYTGGTSDADTIAAQKEEAKELASALRIAFVTGTVTDESTVATDSDFKIAAFTDKNISSATYNTSSSQTAGGSVITSDTPIKTISADTNGTASEFGTAVTNTLTEYTLSGASSGTSSSATTVSSEGKTPLFHLTANTPKRVTIYIWLEGTDKDCVTALSAFRAGVYLPFVGAEAATGEGSENKVVTYSITDDNEPIIDEEAE